MNFVSRTLSSKPLVYSILDYPGRFVHLLIEVALQILGDAIHESSSWTLAHEAPGLHFTLGEGLIPPPALLPGAP